MKIFIIDTYYGDFVKDFYARNQALASVPYAKQKQALLAEKFGTADFYSMNFNALGQAADEFIINCEPLQRQWASEHNISFRENRFQNIPKVRVLFKSNWKEKILEAQLFAYQPDVIFCLDINCTSVQLFKKVKKRFNTIIVGKIASLLPPQSLFEPYDLLISSLPHYIEKFRQWGKRAEYLPLSFEPSVLPLLRGRSPTGVQWTPRNGVGGVRDNTTYDVTHIGGYGPIHNERNEVLEAVAKKIPLDCWGYGFDNLAPQSSLRSHYHGQSWGVHMYNLLHNSKITLTKHITAVANGFANNMTLFEATGCGTLLLTDWKENLPNLFEPGKEIETYRTPEELIEKIQYYLTHEHERTRIASAGQKRTLAEHTYAHRVKTLLHMFQKL